MLGLSSRTIQLKIRKILHITKHEVQDALKQMKKNKAPGMDKLITSNIFKEGGIETVMQLVKQYTQIMKDQRIQTKWKEPKIILLHKRGVRADIKNYRPISLLSHMLRYSQELFKTESRLN